MKEKNHPAHILYVEDDDTIAFLTKDNLQLKGYQVIHVRDGVEALERFRSKTFHLCIIDIMLPRMDGYSLAREIRKSDREVPILFLSAKSLTEDKIKGLSIGADDYITKPFSIDELVLRMEVFLKRSQVFRKMGYSIYSVGSLKFNSENHRIEIRGEKIGLTQRENELLQFLFENRNRLVRREEILNTIWGDDDYFLGRSLDVFISRLRKILSNEPSIQIQNIHGVGYRFLTGTTD